MRVHVKQQEDLPDQNKARRYKGVNVKQEKSETARTQSCAQTCTKVTFHYEDKPRWRGPKNRWKQRWDYSWRDETLNRRTGISSCTCTKQVYARSACFGLRGGALLTHWIKHIYKQGHTDALRFYSVRNMTASREETSFRQENISFYLCFFLHNQYEQVAQRNYSVNVSANRSIQIVRKKPENNCRTNCSHCKSWILKDCSAIF